MEQCSLFAITEEVHGITILKIATKTKVGIQIYLYFIASIVRLITH